MGSEGIEIEVGMGSDSMSGDAKRSRIDGDEEGSDEEEMSDGRRELKETLRAMLSW